MTIIRVVIAQILTTYRLYSIVGASWKLIIGCIPFLAKFFIINHQYNEMKNIKTEMRVKKKVRFNGSLRDETSSCTDDDNDDRPNLGSGESVVSQSAISLHWEQHKIFLKRNEDERQSHEPFLSKFQFASTFKPPPAPIYPMEKLKEMKAVQNDVFESIKDDITTNANKEEWRNQMGLPSPHVYMIIVRNGRTPTLLIRINEQKVNALIDSGANVTIISKDLLTMKELQMMETQDESVKSLAGNVLNIVGHVPVTLEVAGTIYGNGR